MSGYSNINEKRIWLWGMGDLFDAYSSLLNPSLNFPQHHILPCLQCQK